MVSTIIYVNPDHSTFCICLCARDGYIAFILNSLEHRLIATKSCVKYRHGPEVIYKKHSSLSAQLSKASFISNMKGIILNSTWAKSYHLQELTRLAKVTITCMGVRRTQKMLNLFKKTVNRLSFL